MWAHFAAARRAYPSTLEKRYAFDLGRFRGWRGLVFWSLLFSLFAALGVGCWAAYRVFITGLDAAVKGAPFWPGFLLYAGWYAFAIAAVWGLTWSVYRFRRSVDADLTREISRQAKRLLREHGNDTTIVQAEIQQRYPGATDTADLVAQNAVLHTISDEALVDEASAEVFDYLPPIPRHAKRLLNQLRLLLAVANERGLLADGSPLKPCHLGRWAALRERWPDLAVEICLRPGLMADLETDAVNRGAFKKRLLDLPSGCAGMGDLLGFCAPPPEKAHLRLGPVAQMLVYLEKPPEEPVEAEANIPLTRAVAREVVMDNANTGGPA